MTPDNTNNQHIPAIASSAPRVKLVVQSGLGAGTTIHARRVVTILGSRKGCKVNLRHPKVSPVHVAIVNTGVEVIAVDLLTRTGTLLNGLRMQHEELSDGDVLAIGPWEFRVDVESADGSKIDDVAAAGPAVPHRALVLELLPSGRVLQPDRDICLIGRRSGCDITVSDNRVSRAHALLLYHMGYPAILDLLSHNRTLINDSSAVFQILADGDTISVGETEFRARVAGSPADAKAPEPPEKVATGGGHTSQKAPHSDQIDIESVEGSQTWAIADNAERAAKRR